MFMLLVLIMFLLLLPLYWVYRALMRSEVPSARRLGNTAGAVFAVLFCALALVVRSAVIDSAIVSSSSMEPTLMVGDRVFINNMAYESCDPAHGDIITFGLPSRRAGVETEDILTKRVIGVPGDVIEVKKGAVYRNGVPLRESYIREPMEYNMPAVTVPPGGLFVLGDNRNDSDDSHEWGMLDRRRVIAKLTIRFWPLRRAGAVR